MKITKTQLREIIREEILNESSFHAKQITDFIKKNKDTHFDRLGFTPLIQIKGYRNKTNDLNISFEALEKLAKIMMKDSVNKSKSR